MIVLDIDTQVDLCCPGGRNLKPDVTKILDSCEDVINHAVRNKILIVGSVVTNTWKQNWCVKGKPGWMKAHETACKKTIYVPQTAEWTLQDILTTYPDVQSILLETDKESNLFTNPSWELILEPYKTQEILIVGLMTKFHLQQFEELGYTKMTPARNACYYLSF